MNSLGRGNFGVVFGGGKRQGKPKIIRVGVIWDHDDGDDEDMFHAFISSSHNKHG
jgi:hypothetical protein